MDSMEVLKQNLAAAVTFQSTPLRNERIYGTSADSTPLMAAKISVKYDGKVRREQHHFPQTEDLPL
jgi:hypothetical protein